MRSFTHSALLAAGISAILLTPVVSGHGWNEIDAQFPAGRSEHAMAYEDLSGAVILFGGTDGTTLYNDTWLYAGGQWTQGPAAPPGLTPRAKHAMAYHFQFKNLVLVGGQDANGVTNDTWEFNGTAWVAGTTPPQLSPRANHAMTYDWDRGSVVLFGGWDGSFFSDTWIYNGISWGQGAVAPAGLVARDGHMMAYDRDQMVTVLHGGWDGVQHLDDTWIWDGMNWTQGPSPATGQGGRAFGIMARDVQTGNIVMFGGEDGSGPLDETWRYDGAAWSSGPATAAGPRTMIAGAFMTSRGMIVVQGGNDGTNNLADTWTYRDGSADYLVGTGKGFPNPNQVRIFNSGGQGPTQDFLAYGAGQWGTNVAAADVFGTGLDSILTGPGPGAVYGPQIRGFNPDTSPIAKINLFAYGTLKFGANVARADNDGDGFTEILTGAGPGEVFGPHVRAFNFDGSAISAIARINFFAYGTLKYGVNVASGDLENDNFDELLTGAGPGAIFTAQVRGWNQDGGSLSSMAKINFNGNSARYGVLVAGGDVEVDGYDEISTAAGPEPTGGALVNGFDFDATSVMAKWNLTPFVTLYGANAGLADVGDLLGDDILVASGPDPAADSTVRTFSYQGAPTVFLQSFQAFPGTAYGVSVTGGIYEQ